MAALEGLGVNDKAELVCSLSAILCSDSKVELSAENLSAVIAASGNAVAPHWVPAFSSTLQKSGGIDLFLKGPGEGA
jgi:ribosomal protein L12E/L44/L45/RPP1/RPP2